METPTAVIATCGNCGEVTHRVLKGRITGRRETIFEGVVKCQRCGRVQTLVLREPKPIKIPLVLSWMEKSERLEMELEPYTVLAVGDSMDFDDGRIQITAIESKGRRVQSSRVEEVDTVWAKKADKVRVKVTVAKGRKAISRDIIADSQKEFSVGDILEIGKEIAIVEKIRVEQRTVYRGSASASDVKRLYAAVERPLRSSRFAPKEIGSGRNTDKGRRKARHRQ